MFPAAVIHRAKIFATVIITAFLCILVSEYASAGDMMSTICNKHVVSVGDMKGEVLAKCGKPLSTFAGKAGDRVSVSAHPAGTGKKARLKSGKATKGAETWTYNIDGSYRFFIFRSGRLERIETGGLAH
jgi:hypothetical protein